MTGQGNVGGAAGENDVDGGCTTLVSPLFPIVGADHVFLRYARWYGEGGNSTDDEFAVDVSNDDGQTWLPLERVPEIDNTWRTVLLDVGAVVPLTAPLRFRFVACDLNQGGLVEAAIDDFRLEVAWMLLTGAGDALLPSRAGLTQNRPNPFRTSTRISYALPAASAARILVYDAAGRRVRALLDQRMPAGLHEVFWDGRDDAGRPVGSGVYFCRMEAGTFRQCRTMTILR